MTVIVERDQEGKDIVGSKTSEIDHSLEQYAIDKENSKKLWMFWRYQ